MSTSLLSPELSRALETLQRAVLEADASFRAVSDLANPAGGPLLRVSPGVWAVGAPPEAESPAAEGA